MQRRKFLAAASAAALPLALGATAISGDAAAGRDLIELRTYEITFGGSGAGVLMEYVTNALGPALERLGCPPPRMMREFGNDEPANLLVMIVYPDAATWIAAQDLSGDAAYSSAAAEYNKVPAAKPVFNRYGSQLLQSFTGWPRATPPGEAAGLFELRTYEGYSEDAVTRKTSMFNDEELPLFLEVGLNPVFFGKMIAGPYRPSLVYMLHFKDMEDRQSSWGKFGPHPDWKVMSAKEQYADSVSNIRRVFFVPA